MLVERSGDSPAWRQQQTRATHRVGEAGVCWGGRELRSRQILAGNGEQHCGGQQAATLRSLYYQHRSPLFRN